ncbi:MAG: hypothetical protein GDA37_08190 [Ekhidna sp.]|nr:hypothetical protein [Ekhidna sp.]
MSSIAQTFSPAFYAPSKRKTTYITLKDGTEVSVRVKKFYRKRGLIKKLKIISSSSGKKVKINPKEIDYMYVAPSAFGKLTQKIGAATDLTRIQDNELSSEHLNNGYLYMESSRVQIKKKKVMDIMLQVMNPTFSKKIKVYDDPFARETYGVGVGPVTLAGGLDKSYYIKKAGEEIARRIKKAEYKRDMDELFSECPSVIQKYGDTPQWSEFEQFIYDYSIMCD